MEEAQHPGQVSAFPAELYQGFPVYRESDGFYASLDPGIAPFVRTLREHGVETFESCEGGTGHAFPVPTIRFHGERYEGFRALAVALCYDHPVAELRRVWSLQDREPVGPDWQLVYARPWRGEDAADKAGADAIRRQLGRAVSGALRSAIAAHGAITEEMIPSATNRVVGQLIATFGEHLTVRPEPLGEGARDG